MSVLWHRKEKSSYAQVEHFVAQGRKHYLKYFQILHAKVDWDTQEPPRHAKYPTSMPQLIDRQYH